MSGQQPAANRAIAPTATLRQRFGGKWKRGAIIMGGAAAVLLVVFMVSSPAPKQKPTPPPPRPTHTTYDPPQPPPMLQVAASVPMQPPPPATLAQPPPPTVATTVAGESKRPASVSFTVAALPDYLKAKVEAEKRPAAPPTSGIAYKPFALEGGKTFTIPDRSLVLSPGPLICITDTLIITGATGEAPFMCHLERDAMSPTNVTLMEAGTRIIGHYQSLVGEGQNRVVAVTATAETPNGVVVPLGGPIGDQLGAAGAPGSVDNHWWQRIGGALILSLVEGGMQLAQSELQKGNGNTTLTLNSGGGGGGLAEVTRQMLSKSINIPPTITLPQGSRISLWSTRYIDFSGSYRLETRR